MRMFRLIVIGAVLATAQARADDAPPKPMPVLNASDTQAALARAETVGRLMYLHDRAAEHALETLVTKDRKFRKDKRVKDWITEARGDSVVVSFLDATPAVLYRVTVDAQGAVAGTPEVLAVPVALTPYEAAAAQARRAASTPQIAACAPTYKMVAIPDGASLDHWAVYLLPGTRDPRFIPLGGSFKVDVTRGQVTANRPFTYSCIQLEKGPKVAAIVTMHLLDPTPMEVHVYWGLWGRIPLFVGTSNNLMWNIDDGHITLVEDEPSTASP
ncbi:hypothetical protein [Stenotrophomonas sp.]|uniref:hypothetical protein n=1 Tax=Stenotrophomonas sp. TaxID=69392 RepID=UPI0028983C91|nr:hypothetical protein [Stenotrophomonas sp.]